VLARAVRWRLQHTIMRCAHKTAVFDGAAAVFVDCMGNAPGEARARRVCRPTQ